MAAAPTRASPLVMLLGVIFLFASNVLAASAVLGVDLGTEYIKASLVKPGVPLDIVLTKDSRRKETSAVAFKPSRGGAQEGSYPERLYGSDAIALAARFPGEVYPNLKTLLGLPVTDPVVQDYAARHPALQLQSHPTRETAQFKSNTVTAEEDAWLVEELLAMELQNVQKNAETAAGDGTSVRSIVLTVPPFYTTEEKRAVESAARLAGLNVLSLISDGLAVGLNYATSRQFPNINEGARPEYHMVFDMGAGSTKASVMKFQSRNVKDVGKYNKTIQEVQLMGAGWDRTLGGDTLNNLIIDDMVNQFVESKGGKKIGATAEAVKAHGRAIAKLTKEAERVRHVLSANQNTQASFEGLYEDVDFKYKLTRTDFEALAEAHADRVSAAVQDALKMAGLDIADVSSVILHGGATRTPFVQKALEKAVGSADKLRSNVNSDEAAVFGAGFRAAGLSPSFRVKEIRLSEGSSYPVGMKWTTGSGKEQTQRMWSPISPLGGPAKEFTFTESQDFTTTFYQQVGDNYKEVKALTTKNLTATIEQMKEKYPSCVDSGVFFRVGAKLRGENGEVEIVKAAVECEAEMKEGFVDGVKNLFGFGKKDQEPLKDGEKGSDAETETVVGSEETSGESAEGASTSTEGSETTASSSTDAAESSATGAAEEVKKVELVSIPVDYTLEKLGMPELTKEQLKTGVDRLKAFSASDRARIQREEALNQLEAFTYRIRDMVEDESFVAVSTDDERSKLKEASSAASEWLYDDGAEAGKDELKTKLKDLQKLVNPIQKRREEAENRPEQVQQLKTVLGQTTDFVDAMRKTIDEYEEWEASSKKAEESSPSEEDETADDSDESTEDSTEDAKEEKTEEESGPLPPLYNREELDTLLEQVESTTEWLADLESKQSELPPTADPVLLVTEITVKRQKMEMAGRDLALKGTRKYASDRTKSKTKSSKKSSKTSSADAADKTIKIGDDSYSAEDLEEMIKNMSEDDWNKVHEEARRQGEAKDETHDEL